MAYKKETISTVDNIRFFYKTDDIFNEVSEVTAFKAASITNQEGKPSFDSVQITTDEKRHLKTYIRKSVLEIFDILFKALGESPLFFAENITVDGFTGEASGGFILDNARYRAINLSVIDSKIQDAIVNYVLANWYFLKNLPDDSAIHQAKYNKLLVEIDQRSLALRLPK